MKVPLLDLRPPLEELRDEIVEAVTQVIDSTRYIMGPEIDGLEKEISAYCGTKDAVGVSSGTDALLLALMVLDVGPGDLVMTSNFSFFATAGVVARLNATPVFVDIDPQTFNIDPESLSRALAEMDAQTRKRVKAIIPVHLYGQCADMEAILKISREYNIPVIEDGAQAIGAECEIDGQKRSAGSSGEFGCFSFFPSKNLGGVGDGGIVTINNSEMADQLRLKRVHGGERKYYHRVIGGNFRLDPIQATVIRVKLPHLNKWHSQRQDNAEHYNKLFAEKDLGGKVQLPFVGHSENLQNPHIYNQYVIKAERRDELQAFLAENEIASEVYYPLPFHLQECFLHLGGKTGDFPVSEAAAEEVLALPVYPGMTKEMRETVVEQIANFYQS
ncbi:MAG: transcriptional regulator [Deltaproteobacteria bacterium]|jgi:dTDP-4-amino-4,6-dideoxygalactose transaminase|nr:transcriptional regulator [Deltaproteobacteria bacterium]MDP6307814.1 DegT/DnrJ/EryC1/StrS family aminotransferase [SAR324 cluster bacterium]MDP7169869.1 DegT/DnrJ/EryC1/StrS family aminotransferase [SAR324 cluster bacterium]MDP7582917.1 DegT/DnrJ/EryC1/StrS family aminotransferase [SAR324 cluster bacterium]HBR60187.1 transcriptional regulator [Deltaproteobacteria bacterium]|tara:strand:+ start:2146 stop:3306 length:1161 start_codon:yes stop_codon:yes gene_type:complete